ncbi:hypothetical protein [Streptomyces sp. NPDC090022]|uniref:hypothetical protein n=1 Tax=Streptomyces sp. NPDC090022 TaxID=3365920 RepID=UPI00381330C0
MTPGRSYRAFRAAMFAATCVLLAALGHVLMSGTAVPWWALAAALAGTGAVAWCAAGRERGLLAVTSATVAVQAALHAGFSLAQAAAHGGGSGAAPLARRWVQYLLCGATGTGSARPAEGGHAHHHAMGTMPSGHPMTDLAGAADAVGMGGVGGMSGTAGMDGPHAMAPSGMLAAHLLAALLCGLWLAYGEQGAFRVLRAVAGWLLVPLRPLLRLPAPPDLPRRRARRDRGSGPLRRLLPGHTITSRGPPPGTAVV